MNKLILIDIEFNSRPWKIGLTPEWIEYRIKIFMNYTLKSLINQTNQSFLCLLRYNTMTEDIINHELSKYDKLPSNVLFINNDKADNEILKRLHGYDYLYLVRLDCDDMYHPLFIEKLTNFKQKKETQVIINQNGYVYDVVNDSLGTWIHKSPPFYTLIYNSTNYINGKRYVLKGGHEGAIKLKFELLDGYNYVVVIHEKNTLNKFKNHLAKVISNENSKNKILKELKLK